MDPERGMNQLRWLKVFGVYVPIAAIFALEVLRIFVEASIEGEGFRHSLGEQGGPAVFMIVAVALFAFVMFASIERVQRALMRQNRELAAVNAVSTAVQGELAVNEVIDAVMESVIESTGASDVSVTVFDDEDGARTPDTTAAQVTRQASSGRAGKEPLRLVDIPLSTASGIVGRMRLGLPDRVDGPDLLAASTLQNIGYQLASSIQTAQLFADLRRRQLDGHALYDVLVQISDQGPLAGTLVAIVRHAHERLDADEALMCLYPESAHLVESDDDEVDPAGGGNVCISSTRPALKRGCAHGSCTNRSLAFGEHASVMIAGRGIVLGELSVGRRLDRSFTGRDRELLGTLSDLASIAITNAAMRENEQLAAIRGERDRIAREMHDSLAQVLGATHLRLRALLGRADVDRSGAVAAELAELAEISGDAYHDVREAILGLRESTKAERGLVESLTAYLEKYERQSGIKAKLETEVDGELVLSPLSEIQVIRVVQEALTNVRKHSGAEAVTVRIESVAGHVTFVVEDDGTGFELATAGTGKDSFGLQSMRERVALIGGELTVVATPGSGCRVIVSLPDSHHAVAS